MIALLVGAAVGFVGYLAYFFIKRAVDKRKNKHVETATEE